MLILFVFMIDHNVLHKCIPVAVAYLPVIIHLYGKRSAQDAVNSYNKSFRFLFFGKEIIMDLFTVHINIQVRVLIAGLRTRCGYSYLIFALF